MSQVNVARVPTKFGAEESPLPVVNGTKGESQKVEKRAKVNESNVSNSGNSS